MVYLLLGRGFEEIEAVAPCDLLRRAGLAVQLVGVGERTVVGSHGVAITADIGLEEIDLAQMQMVILPGGLKGVQTICACSDALTLVRRAYDADKYIAAICAAPTILAKLAITDGRSATCYPGMESQMGSAQIRNLPVVTDGKIITGQAAGSAVVFALALIRALKGEAAAQKVAQSIVCE